VLGAGRLLPKVPVMAELTYRYAGPADVAPVVALVESAYRGEESRAGWTSEAELIGGQRTDAAMVSALVAEPGARVLLAEEAGILQACCELREPGTPGGAAYFGLFAVRPSLQRGGYGRIVLAEAERIARDGLGAAALEMTVIRQRASLIAWYERRGYERTGETRPFPYGDERFGLPKVSGLEFVTLAKPLR
jgi:ribosomal protein S18 acetylase RimI-like enzyme